MLNLLQLVPMSILLKKIGNIMVSTILVVQGPKEMKAAEQSVPENRSTAC